MPQPICACDQCDGTQPDPGIEVDNKPQDYAKGRDPQLEQSIKES